MEYNKAKKADKSEKESGTPVVYPDREVIYALRCGGKQWVVAEC